MRWLVLTAITLSCSLLSPASTTTAQVAYDPQYFPPPGVQAAPWSSADEAWLARNRAFALAGKILTVVGVASLIVGTATDQPGMWLPGGGVQSLGQLMWSIAELRGAKQLRARGVDVTKAPGIAAVVGAFVAPAVTWISGPIQSARIREAHEMVSLAPRAQARVSSFGFGLRASF